MGREAVVKIGVCGALSCVALSRAVSAPDAGAIPYPHPVIMEALFDVPADAAGDANGDGVRDAVGDEFVEIMNPHDRAIDLGGYVLTSRLADPRKAGGRGVRFVFPACRLAPGEVAVVFNGLDAAIPGAVGNEEAAPGEGNSVFAGAMVFSMENDSKGRALANAGDFVLLTAPDGTAVDCLVWGEPKEAPPAGTLRVAGSAKKGKSSLQRTGPWDEPRMHAAVDDEVCSPGEIPVGKR